MAQLKFWIDRNFQGDNLYCNTLYLVVNQQDAIEINGFLQESLDRDLIYRYFFLKHRDLYDRYRPKKWTDIQKILTNEPIDYQFHYLKEDHFEINVMTQVNATHANNLVNKINTVNQNGPHDPYDDLDWWDFQ